MPEDDEAKRSRRLDRIVRDLLAGRRPKIGPADARDRDAIMAAASLAAAKEPYPRMSPAFRRRLAARLEPAREPGLLSRRSALVAGLAAMVGAVTGAAVELPLSQRRVRHRRFPDHVTGVVPAAAAAPDPGPADDRRPRGGRLDMSVNGAHKSRLAALDLCLQLLEDALASGQVRV